MAPSLSTNPRQRQLREDMRQALSSADASQLRRLSLQVIHRQGPDVLKRLMQLLAEGEQLRFWLDALQPVQVAVAPQLQVPSAQPAVSIVQGPVAEPAALPLQADAVVAEAEPAAPEVEEEPLLAAEAASGNPELSLPEDVEIAPPEQAKESPVTTASVAAESVEEEPEVQVVSSFENLAVAEPVALDSIAEAAVAQEALATPIAADAEGSNRSEQAQVAVSDQAVEPPVTAFSGAAEPVEEPEAQAAPDFDVVSVAEPEALELQTDVAVAASEPATPEVDEKPLLAAQAVIETSEVGEPLEAVSPLQAVEPLAAERNVEALPVQPKPIREESIKFAAPPKRVVATPAPLERSRLNQRLKGWLPGSGSANRQAA